MLSKEYLANHEFMNLLQHTASLKDMTGQQFDCVYLTGGHGTMYDFPDNESLQQIIRGQYESGRIMAAVCHGVGGLLNVKLSNGEYLLKGKDVTGYSWFEETLARRKGAVPFNLEQSLKDRGAHYRKAIIPMTSNVREEMMRNVIDACKAHRCKLVFFDNTCMYPKTAEPQTEATPFVPKGRKAVVRAKMATMLLDEMRQGNIEAVICRAPEFYGPGKTQSLTNTLIFDNIRQGKKPKVPLRDDTLRTLIWTPDASRAIALIGNTPNAYNQTWHLPCDDNRLTYGQLIEAAAEVCGKHLSYSVLKMWLLKPGSVFNKQLREVQELLPRYGYDDNIFVSDKFKQRFPDFRITAYKEGIRKLMGK